MVWIPKNTVHNVWLIMDNWKTILLCSDSTNSWSKTGSSSSYVDLHRSVSLVYTKPCLTWKLLMQLFWMWGGKSTWLPWNLEKLAIGLSKCNRVILQMYGSGGSHIFVQYCFHQSIKHISTLWCNFFPVLAFGVLSMGYALCIQYIDTTIIQLGFILSGSFGGPILAVFTLGLFSPWCNAKVK